MATAIAKAGSPLHVWTDRLGSSEAVGIVGTPLVLLVGALAIWLMVRLR